VPWTRTPSTYQGDAKLLRQDSSKLCAGTPSPELADQKRALGGRRGWLV
jgi:hypothetical protein